MAAPLVSLHIASNAEGFATAGDGALERLLARVGVAVDAERAGSGKGLVASRADVSVLALGIRRRRRRGDVVMVLPWVSTSWRDHRQRRREGLRERPLEIETRHLGRCRARIVPRHGGLAEIGGSGEVRLIRRRLDGNSRGSASVHGRHLLVTGIHLTQWWGGLEVVVGTIGHLTHRPCRGRVVPFERSFGGHGWTRRKCRPQYCRVAIVG